MCETVERSINTKTARIIGKFGGNEQGPTLVFFGGIHGNEMAGVEAIEQVFEELESIAAVIKGTVYGVRGNIPAQLKGERFLDKDLNRIWTTPKIEQVINKHDAGLYREERELIEIYQLVQSVLESESPPFYFIDFHTTSSKTLPFITINDALINRRFSQLFPVPVILGIEEYLEGPLLSHLNERGYVSLGFESGQHADRQSVKNSISFIWLTLVFSGVIDKGSVSTYELHYGELKDSASHNMTFYEVIHRHPIKPTHIFEMYNGFKSFEHVSKGIPLARHNGEEIKMEKNGILFMPLYQDQGEEGFFLIRKIPTWALKLSGFLRGLRIDAMLTLLPGVSWSDKDAEKLVVNRTVARFFTKPFFHLLGYRNRVRDKKHYLMTNRERTAKNAMYKNEWWFRN